MGDILISHINSVKHLGKCAVYQGEPEKLIHGMNLLVLRVDTEKVNPVFTFYLLCNSGFRRQYSKITKNSVNQSSFNISSFKRLLSFSPPLELQQRFAAIVESVEQQKAAQRAHLDELDTLFACLQQRAFAGELVT